MNTIYNDGALVPILSGDGLTFISGVDLVIQTLDLPARRKQLSHTSCPTIDTALDA